LLKIEKRSWLFFLLVCVLTFFTFSVYAEAQVAFPYKDPSLPVTDRVTDLINRMTLAEKVGQMTQVARDYIISPSDIATYGLGGLLSGGGSTPRPNTPAGWRKMLENYQKEALSTRLGIPLLYGIDAVHGHNNAFGAVIYPHHIGLGAADDPELVQEIGAQTAESLKATGIPWDFSPCVAVAQDLRWGRTYESYGKNPLLVARLGKAEMLGLQGPHLGSTGVLATLKHFAGDGSTQDGIDRGNDVLTWQEFQATPLVPYAKILPAGPGCVMASYSSWNGEPMHANRKLITGWLKEKEGFQGFVVSDWGAVALLPGNLETQVASAINAGVDMVMVPDKYSDFIHAVTADVNSGKIPMARINDAVRRILATKFALGLFEHPIPDSDLPDKGLSQFSNKAQRDLARRAAEESFTLLKNQGVLPLKAGKNLLVIGPKADDMGDLCGGWTLTWQGLEGAPIPGSSLLDGLNQVYGSSHVFYAREGDLSSVPSTFLPDAVILVIGEKPYAEMKGDNPTLTMDSDDQALWDRISGHLPNVPLVTLVVSGRPLVMNNILNTSVAFAEVWLPGSEAGADARVLAGLDSPRGHLPQPWPSESDQLHSVYPVGYGLSYKVIH
jgi:beta-glucosidase